MLKSILVSLIIVGVLIAVPKSATIPVPTKNLVGGQVDTDNIGVVKVEEIKIDAVPQKMNLQGYLTTAAGDTFSGNRSIQFKIYRVGSEVWQETQTVYVQKSLFSVILGSVTPITSSIFEPGTTCELELIVEGQTLAPRIEITSVGFAFKSVKSDTADYALNSGTIYRPITPPIHGNEIAKPCTLQASVASPNAVLRVKNTGSGNGVHVDTAGTEGLRIIRTGQRAISIDDAGYTGIRIDSTHNSYTGYYIHHADYHGLGIDHAGSDGVYVSSAGSDGVYVGDAGNRGVYVDDAKVGVVAYGDSCSGDYFVTISPPYPGDWGLCAHSYQNNISYGAIKAYGYGYSTGGWNSYLKGKEDGAPCIISPERTIIVYGTAKLNNGKAEINYPATFTQNIRLDMPISLNITPSDDPAGVLFTQKNGIAGFSVTLKEIPSWSGDKDINFDWVAIGTLQEPETTPEAKANWENAMREREKERAQNEKVTGEHGDKR